MKEYDKIIIGGGLYGLYAALYCGTKGENVLLLEKDPEAFSRATYVNQARVHMGYHYPRSFSTAIKSAGYFERFVKDYGFCILESFDKVYAISSAFSWTSSSQFKKFSDNANLLCEEISTDKYFNANLCEGAFLTREYTYDAQLLKNHFLEAISETPSIHLKYDAEIDKIQKDGSCFSVSLKDGSVFVSGFVLNATYASVNQIHNMLGFETFKIKYELCEIILCKVSDELKGVGLTVMDGPFFSIMPFGKTGYHSLTSVTFTPHITSYSSVPQFPCQEKSNGYCTPSKLGNCNTCLCKPESAWPYMSKLARKYMRESYGFDYAYSLYSIKPILMASEIDDSRPTVIKQLSDNPQFYSVLSGKINTVYDLDDVLNYG